MNRHHELLAMAVLIVAGAASFMLLDRPSSFDRHDSALGPGPTVSATRTPGASTPSSAPVITHHPTPTPTMPSPSGSAISTPTPTATTRNVVSHVSTTTTATATATATETRPAPGPTVTDTVTASPLPTGLLGALCPVPLVTLVCGLLGTP